MIHHAELRIYETAPCLCDDLGEGCEKSSYEVFVVLEHTGEEIAIEDVFERLMSGDELRVKPGTPLIRNTLD